MAGGVVLAPDDGETLTDEPRRFGLEGYLRELAATGGPPDPELASKPRHLTVGFGGRF